MKVYVDDYNVIGDDGEIPSGLGDSPNLIDAKLLENYAWEECGWTEKLRIVDIRVDEYLEFRDAVDTIHKILKKVYDQIEESE
jgi:hypothetical protein